MATYKGRKKPQFESFVMMGRDTVLHCDKWKQLSSKAKVLYLMIKAKHTGTNNGDIVLHYNELRLVKGFSSDATVRNAFKELEKVGWITWDSKGGMYRIPNKYRLTGTYDHHIWDRSHTSAGKYKEPTHSIVQKPWPIKEDTLPSQTGQPTTPSPEPARTTESVATDPKKCS